MFQAGKTLSARKWHAAFSPEGYLDIGNTLSRIHRGVITFVDLKHFLNMFEDVIIYSLILHLHTDQVH